MICGVAVGLACSRQTTAKSLDLVLPVAVSMTVVVQRVILDFS